MSELNVKVTKFQDRKFWLMYYDDPMTGKRVSRSTKCDKKKDAVKAAAVWEDELRSGRYKPPSQITWEEFRDRYETEVVSGLAPRTSGLVSTVFGHVERILQPDKLSKVSAERLSYLQSELRAGDSKSKSKAARPRSPATVKSYLAHLKAALRWAVDMGMLHELPKIKMPTRDKGTKMMKGRPITAEEFDRMLAKVELGLLAAAKRTANKGTGKRIVSETAKAERQGRQCTSAVTAAPSWARLLRGLWLSGLRLGEAMDLYWDDETKLTVDLTGRRPMFRIRAELEKGNQDRLLPMTPDFAEFLQSIPKHERTGPVFRPLTMDGDESRSSEHAGKVISAIGKLAGVKVDTDIETGKVKFASAHDLRRAFGERWAHRIMPTVLQQLMRHESVDTTLKYYVGQNADGVADAVWKAIETPSVVNSFVNNQASSPVGSASKKAATSNEETAF